MRYIILAILVYLVYLIIRFFLKIYLNASQSSNGTKNGTSKKEKSKIDLNKIEEADYEEIKSSKKEN